MIGIVKDAFNKLRATYHEPEAMLIFSSNDATFGCHWDCCYLVELGTVHCQLQNTASFCRSQTDKLNGYTMKIYGHRFMALYRRQ